MIEISKPLQTSTNYFSLAKTTGYYIYIYVYIIYIYNMLAFDGFTPIQIRNGDRMYVQGPYFSSGGRVKQC